MLIAMIKLLFASVPALRPQSGHSPERIDHDFERVSGARVSVRRVHLVSGDFGRVVDLNPPLPVQVGSPHLGVVFDCQQDEAGALPTSYPVTVLAPERLPPGVRACFIDGPTYGPFGVRQPAWWGQLRGRVILGRMPRQLDESEADADLGDSLATVTLPV
jgi:hypothetical protein